MYSEYAEEFVTVFGSSVISEPTSLQDGRYIHTTYRGPCIAANGTRPLRRTVQSCVEISLSPSTNLVPFLP